MTVTVNHNLFQKIFFSIFLFIFVAAGFCYADIMPGRFKITESESEFDLLYFVTPEMTVIEAEPNEDVNVTQAFLIQKNDIKAEVRYSLFTDTGTSTDNLQMQYAMWVFMCVSNITGIDPSEVSLSAFNDADVKQEFNGDFGCTGFFQDPQSDYAKGYKYMMVEFFYKNGQGLVMRTFLFNDINFLGLTEQGISVDSIWYQNYHTFEFMERGPDGSWVHRE